MNNSRFSLIVLTACAFSVSGLRAQAPAAAAPAATPSVSAPASTGKTDVAEEEEGSGALRAKFMALTPEERQKVKAARQAAMKDPAVIAAKANRASDRRGFRTAMREAMVKSDPSVAPILDKLAANIREKRAEKKGL